MYPLQVIHSKCSIAWLVRHDSNSLSRNATNNIKTQIFYKFDVVKLLTFVVNRISPLVWAFWMSVAGIKGTNWFFDSTLVWWIHCMYVRTSHFTVVFVFHTCRAEGLPICYESPKNVIERACGQRAVSRGSIVQCANCCFFLVPPEWHGASSKALAFCPVKLKRK